MQPEPPASRTSARPISQCIRGRLPYPAREEDRGQWTERSSKAPRRSSLRKRTAEYPGRRPDGPLRQGTGYRDRCEAVGAFHSILDARSLLRVPGSRHFSREIFSGGAYLIGRKAIGAWQIGLNSAVKPIGDTLAVFGLLEPLFV